jgi:hypothetical protein
VRVDAVLTQDDTLTVVVADPGDGGALLRLADTGSGLFAAELGWPIAFGELIDDVFDGSVPAVEPGDPARRAIIVREGVEKPRRVANLSARGVAASGDDAMVAGFVVTGGGAGVLLRAVGPGLADFGLAGVLGQLRMDLNNGDGVIASNQQWHASADRDAIAATGALVGAFPLLETNDDAALVGTFAAQPYTAVISGLAGARGLVLAEAYDTSSDIGLSPLTNISARARVGTGNDVLIAGFVIEGEAPQLVLIRGAGPKLGDFGIAGFLVDPELEVFRRDPVAGTETGIAYNDDWHTAPEAARIAATGDAAGAFPLLDAGADAAVLLYLPPGIYSAIVRGVGGAEGVALAEIYRVIETP